MTDNTYLMVGDENMLGVTEYWPELATFASRINPFASNDTIFRHTIEYLFDPHRPLVDHVIIGWVHPQRFESYESDGTRWKYYDPSVTTNPRWLHSRPEVEYNTTTYPEFHYMNSVMNLNNNPRALRLGTEKLINYMIAIQSVLRELALPYTFIAWYPIKYEQIVEHKPFLSIDKNRFLNFNRYERSMINMHKHFKARGLFGDRITTTDHQVYSLFNPNGQKYLAEVINRFITKDQHL